MIAGGAAAKDGRLKVGQRILEVNNQSLLGAAHMDAVRALKNVQEKLTILVCDGFEPEELERSIPISKSSEEVVHVVVQPGGAHMHVHTHRERPTYVHLRNYCNRSSLLLP